MMQRNYTMCMRNNEEGFIDQLYYLNPPLRKM